MVELRFFEICRNSEYLLPLGQGIRVSFILTACGAIAGFILAIGLSTVRYARVPVLGRISAAPGAGDMARRMRGARPPDTARHRFRCVSAP